jgi:hypothetical protein
MNSLPARYRQIMLLYHWRGVTMRAIGLVFGVNESRCIADSQARAGAHGWNSEIERDQVIGRASRMSRISAPVPGSRQEAVG